MFSIHLESCMYDPTRIVPSRYPALITLLLPFHSASFIHLYFFQVLAIKKKTATALILVMAAESFAFMSEAEKHPAGDRGVIAVCVLLQGESLCKGYSIVCCRGKFRIRSLGVVHSVFPFAFLAFCSRVVLDFLKFLQLTSSAEPVQR